MSIKKYLFLLIVLLSFLSLFSCNNVEYKGSEIVIEEVIPSNEDSETNNNKNVSIKSSLNVAKYLLRMIPADVNTNAVVFGDTRQSSVLVNGKTYATFKEVSPDNIQGIGYVSQGSWLVSIIALDSDDNEVYVYGGKSGDDPDYSSIDYSYGELIYINSDSTHIVVNLEEAIGSGNTGTISLNNYKFRLVSDLNKYGVKELDGIQIRVILESLDGAYSNTDEIVVDKSKVSYATQEDGSTDYSVAVINDLVVANSIPNGVYSLKVIMDECDGTNWIQAAGVTYSFTAIRDSNATISTGSSSEIDLDPYDYVTPGTGDSGIIIDSGTNATVTIETNLTPTSTVTEETTVTFKGKVDNTATSGQWFVNGVSTSSGSTFTYTPSGMSGKTVTITYMILDSSYNTISANYYLTVSASSTTSSTP